VLGCKTYVQIPKERHVISQKVTGHAKVGILVGYKGSHIFRVYVPSRRRPVESKIVRSSNVRFDEEGLITKPFPKEDEEADIQIPVKNRGEAANQDRQDSDLIHQRVPNMHQQHQHQSELEKVIIPELIETDLEHKKSQDSDNKHSLPDEDKDSPAEEKLKKLKEMPEIKAEPEPKQKGLRTQKIYMPRPEFNRVTR
jgi:hypothetical protein